MEGRAGERPRRHPVPRPLLMQCWPMGHTIRLLENPILT